MTDDASPWWMDEDDPTLSPAWKAIMAEVEEAFAVTGADTPPWDDPHEQLPGDQDSPRDWYERVTAPERYEILWARAQAWENVILSHGWAARREVSVDELTWAQDEPGASRPVTVFQPVQPSAGLLVLVRTGEPSGSIPPGIMVGSGSPVVVPCEPIPDCGCDACDYGSACLIEALDSDIIPILDGSYNAGVKTGLHKGKTWCSTPFSAGSSTSYGRSQFRDWTAASTHAGPWFPEWTPMPLTDLP